MSDYIGKQLGNYRLIRLIGQGGFADVYLGEHVHLSTQAAIKILQMRLVGSNLEQFRNEARTIAGLIHPNIVRVLDFGIEDGIPFLVMDYAPNGTLRQRHARGAILPLAPIVQYIKQVASALQYAHDRKFIHRDVKPENMLLAANNQVLLSDFGLVLIAQSTGSRSIQEMSGTVAYMAPEQLQGKPRPASDQYSLGIIVYEWLTGDRPFNGAFAEIASQQMLTPPQPLHERIPGISPAIEEVVMTALAKDPQQRFASVQAFATALEQASLRLHAGTPVIASQQMGTAQSDYATLPGEASRPTAMNTPLVSESSVPTYITPSGQAAQRGAINTPNLSESQQPTYVTPAGQAARGYPMDGPQYREAAQPVITPARETPQGHITDRSFDKLRPQREGVSRRTVVVGLGGIVALGVVGGTAWAATGGLQNTLRGLGFLPTPTSTPHPNPSPQPDPKPQPDPQADPQPDPDPQAAPPVGTILVTYQGGQARWIWTAAWSPDGTRIASGGDDGTVQIWDSATGKQIFAYTAYLDKDTSPQVVTLDWSPDGKRIVSSATYSTSTGFLPDVRVWDATSGATLLTYNGHLPRTAGHSNVVSQVAWSPNGEYIASAGGYDKTVQVWNATTGNTLLTYSGHSFDVWKVKWSPNGKYIASASGDPGTPSTGGDVRVWDPFGGTTITTYTGHGVEVTDISWSPDSTKIASVGRDGTVQVWNATTGNKLLTFPDDEPVSWSPDGQRIVATHYALGGVSSVEVKDATTGNNAYVYTKFTQQVNVLAWSPDSTRIALAGQGNKVFVWQAK